MSNVHASAGAAHVVLLGTQSQISAFCFSSFLDAPDRISTIHDFEHCPSHLELRHSLACRPIPAPVIIRCTSPAPVICCNGVMGVALRCFLSCRCRASAAARSDACSGVVASILVVRAFFLCSAACSKLSVLALPSGWEKGDPMARVEATRKSKDGRVW
jgi:hypothetical protein